MMKWLSATAALSILLALSNVFPPASVSSTQSPGALAANRYWGIVSNLETDALASQAKDLGVGWVRICIFWNQVEVAKGIFDWAAPDAAVHRAVANNLNLYVTITGTPEWANGHKADNVPPRYRQDWVDFV